MLNVRVMPCLDVKDGRVVKGVNFVGLRDAGDPVDCAARYDAEGADELVFLDISATHEGRGLMLDVVRGVADRLFIPFTVGGGVRSVDDFARLLDAGADKVAVNSAAVENPRLIDAAAARYGAQCVVAAVDVRADVVTTHGGRRPTERRMLPWLAELQSRGAGEILLTSMDHDGTRAGFDLDGLARARAALSIPVIASGGAGRAAHFVEAARTGATGLLAASLFHFGELRIGAVKDALRDAGIPTRPAETRDGSHA
ncbi:MAG: hypothetical protein RLZZ299_2319 [Pseudomonadota bacterium]